MLAAWIGHKVASPTPGEETDSLIGISEVNLCHKWPSQQLGNDALPAIISLPPTVGS